jgi:GNAT superfamily N-acetyltransferase
MPMKRLKLHKAKKKDVDLIARFIVEIWGRQGEGPKAHAEAAKRFLLLDAADYDAFVFEHEGRPVAYALARDNGDHVFLRHFVVTAAERRKGFGRACFALLAEEFGDPEFRLDVAADEAEGQAFWPALGFAPAAVMMRREAGAAS